MRYSYTSLVLATMAVGQAVATPHNHAHVHAKKHNEERAASEVLATIDGKVVSWENNWLGGAATTAATVEAIATSVATSVAAEVTSAVEAATTAAAVVASTTASSSVVVASSAADGTLESAIDEVESLVESITTLATTILTALHAEQLLAMGFKAVGENAQTNNGQVWIGTDGAYTNKFINDSGEDLILVVWGSQGSWVNAYQPYITHSVPSGQYATLSFSDGAIGAWAAIYEDTTLVNGQVSNTWGEYTMGQSGVVDVSREVNMDGHSMSIVGPACTTDMDTCVFVCDEGTVCTTGYSLKNCANGSQDGATYGEYDGAASGGCGGLGSSASLVTTFT